MRTTFDGPGKLAGPIRYSSFSLFSLSLITCINLYISFIYSYGNIGILMFYMFVFKSSFFFFYSTIEMVRPEGYTKTPGSERGSRPSSTAPVCGPLLMYGHGHPPPHLRRISLMIKTSSSDT